MNRILVVEDEPAMASLLCQALNESGYSCASAPNGREALGVAQDYDLLIVDVMMPEMGGIELVEHLRQDGYKKPVIFLTARDATSDIVEGLDAGADDYLVKPFKLDELLARVRAHLRRAQETSVEIVWHDLTVNIVRRSAWRSGHELFLSGTEFAVLELLLRRAGDIVPKSLLLKEVWHDEGYRAENIVELYINYLRRKTECFGLPRIVHTVRGKGYVLAKDPPQS